MPDAQLEEFVGGVKKVIAACVDAMPMHAQFIDRYCKAAKP
jgi:tryptophan halogenase